MIELVGSSAFVAALAFGFRHGFDWDHLAAISDLTGTQRTRRGSMRLATIYALGHGCMILVLGSLAIVFAVRIPDSVDVAAGRLVGLSLIGLGAWISWTAITTRGAPPIRSRWMLLLAAARGLLGRRLSEDEVVVIEHSHPHDHDSPMHDHSHPERATGKSGGLALMHSHAHHHVAAAPLDPFMTYSGASAYGIGALHGIGAETPTQLLVFAAASQADGRMAGLALLVCFVAGLLAANTIVACASTLGFAHVLRRPVVAGVLAAVTAAFSLLVGMLLVVGNG